MRINNPMPVIRIVLGYLTMFRLLTKLNLKDYLKNYVFTTLENNKKDYEN